MKSHESEARLMAKCRQLNAELVVAAAKASDSVNAQTDDDSSVLALKQEVCVFTRTFWTALEFASVERSRTHGRRPTRLASARLTFSLPLTNSRCDA